MNFPIYFDFRSPYAFFLWLDLEKRSLPAGIEAEWIPVSISGLLNLQKGRLLHEEYEDPLSPIKRKVFLQDVVRSAQMRGIRLLPPKNARPDTRPAGVLLQMLTVDMRSDFIGRVFEAHWMAAEDISNSNILFSCLPEGIGDRQDLVNEAFDESQLNKIDHQTTEAFAAGVYGVPTFLLDDQVFFGGDRLDQALWWIHNRA